MYISTLVNIYFLPTKLSGSKKARWLAKDKHTQRKSLFFLNTMNDRRHLLNKVFQKLGMILEKSVSKFNLSTYDFKKYVPKPKKNQGDSDDL